MHGGDGSDGVQVWRWVGVGGLVLSGVALLAAPVVLDDSYSWLDHTTSEAGAQGVDGAWMARTGFVVCGAAVAWIAAFRRDRWRVGGTLLHLVFAACMFAVAAFSTEPWFETGTTFDSTESTRHSAAATIMGFAFAFGVFAVAAVRRSGRWRALDLLAVVASVALPLAMVRFGWLDGALQRVMFAIAYVWYGAEALRR